MCVLRQNEFVLTVSVDNEGYDRLAMLVLSHFGYNRHLHPQGVEDLEFPSAQVGRLHTQSIQQWFQQLKSYKIHASFQSRKRLTFLREVHVACYHHSPKLRKQTMMMIILEKQCQLLAISFEQNPCCHLPKPSFSNHCHKSS